MKIDAPKGTKVKYIRPSDSIARYGGNDNPEGILKVGKTYTVDRTEIHSWHTKVYLEEYPGKKFNSNHFE